MARAFSGKSSAGSNPGTGNVGMSGTPGGRGRMGMRPGARSINVGDEMYLWLLVLLEVGFLGFLRHRFRRHHGG